MNLEEPIKSLGDYKVTVKLHREVSVELPVHEALQMARSDRSNGNWPLPRGATFDAHRDIERFSVLKRYGRAAKVQGQIAG